MDIKEFVEQALTQIIDGVIAARTKAGGAEIAPNVQIMYPQHNHAPATNTNGGLYQVWPVRFDLAVTVTSASETKGGAGISIMQVVNLGGQKAGHNESVEVSRISFEVPVRWPMKSSQDEPAG